MGAKKRNGRTTMSSGMTWTMRASVHLSTSTVADDDKLSSDFSHYLVWGTRAARWTLRTRRKEEIMAGI